MEGYQEQVDEAECSGEAEQYMQIPEAERGWSLKWRCECLGVWEGDWTHRDGLVCWLQEFELYSEGMSDS